MKKYLIRGGIFVLFVVIIFVVWQMKILQRINQSWQERQFLNKVESIKNTWRNDKVGGTTPEETLKLFIAAFKAGDLGLASKYFVPEKQAEFLAKMQNWVKLGKKEEIISMLSKAEWGGESDTTQDQMDVWGEKKEALISIFFMKNEFSKRWKISNM